LIFAVLRRLADGEFHSGQALAQALGVSRASVWNALNEAQSMGLSVHRVHGRGYRLSEPLDWLDPARIAAAVAASGLSVEVLDCCGSTNAELLHAAERGAASGRVLVAEMQTQGRGRMGRSWHSGLASALTFSLLWRFDKAVAGLAGLSLTAGAAIARALRRQGVEVALKWPNDLLWRERKLGGILIEVRGDALGPCAAVIGVGLNIRLGAEQRQRIDQPAADLTEAAPIALRRDEWLASVLLELAAALKEFSAHGFAGLREEWIGYHAHQGRQVMLTLHDGTRTIGTAIGVDDTGRLLLAAASGTSAFLSGDVSLRALDDSGH
jgi:BirA family transcriptional regulator, biotin operon repressor / biotin---[acetyl-CoA-carboxylase] ligase